MLGNRKLLSQDTLFWLLGFFSTSSLLAIPVHGALLTMYTVVLSVCFFVLLSNKKRSIKKNQLFDLYKKWTIISILSSFWGLLFFWGKLEWQMAAFEYVPKLIMYFVLFIFLWNSANSLVLSSMILKGLLWGIIINVVVAIVDSSIFYSMGYSIINNYFSYYISISDIRLGMISLIIGPTIRSCGLNSDPANIGLFVTILAAYGLKRKNYWLYGLAFFGFLAALSHTGLVGIVLVSLINFYINKKNKLLVNSISIIAGICVVYYLLSVLDLEYINQMSEAFIERTEDKLDSDSNSEAARVSYWKNFIAAAIFHPTSLIIGTGYGTASYPYLSNNLVESSYFPYDPEQTYFSIFFDIGLFGLIAFLRMNYKVLKLNYKNNNDNISDLVCSSIIGIGIAFLFYHYTVYSVAMLFMVTGVVISSNRFKTINRE